MSNVTVTLAPHHVRALVDARIKLTLLHQLGVDFSLLCDSLDEIVQMCSENRERIPDRSAVRERRHLTPADVRNHGVEPEPHSVHWTRTPR